MTHEKPSHLQKIKKYYFLVKDHHSTLVTE